MIHSPSEIFREYTHRTGIQHEQQPSAAALTRAALGADAAGAGTNDFVAAAHGTGDAHKDAAKRYCYPV